MLKWPAPRKTGSLWTTSLAFTAGTAAAPGGPPLPPTPLLDCHMITALRVQRLFSQVGTSLHLLFLGPLLGNL